jgi:uncharacterized protein with FMN-binding domain
MMNGFTRIAITGLSSAAAIGGLIGLKTIQPTSNDPTSVQPGVPGFGENRPDHGEGYGFGRKGDHGHRVPGFNQGQPEIQPGNQSGQPQAEPTGQPTTQPTQPGTSQTTAPTQTSTGATTYTGEAAQTRYGPVQVQIDVADGTISDIRVVSYPTQDRESRQINEQAVPILIAEGLAAQSAQVDTVSGATYTSEGYRKSLQSAIDQAGI